MKESRDHYYAVFQLSLPNTLGRKNRKKIFYEIAPLRAEKGAGMELPDEFSVWLDHLTQSVQTQYPTETIELVEADIAVNMHELKSVIFQEGIAQGDIVKRVSQTNEEEE